MKIIIRFFMLLLSIAALCCEHEALAAVESDLFVGYDSSFVSGAGGFDNAAVLIANAVASSNYYNDRSGTGAHMRVVGYRQSSQYNYQRTSNGGFVSWLANNDSRISDIVSAGNAAGADLILYICDSTADGAAAVAEQPGRYSSIDSASFWSVVLAHETGGHNFGRSHSDGQLASSPKTIMLHNYCGGGSQGWFTNPNIWVNGVRLIGPGEVCGQGALINGGDNSNPSAANALSQAQRYERVVYGPKLSNVVYDWRFTNAAGAAPAGTTVTDSASGTAAATVLGTGATFTGRGLRIPGGASGSGAAYLSLPSGVVTSGTAVTIEIWATPLSAQNWGRIADFNNGTSNYLTLTSAVDANLGAQRFESKVSGTTVTMDSGLYTTAGVQHHYAMTYTPNGAGTAGTWTWYRDGDLITTLDVAYPLSSLQNLNNWLGRSAYSSDAFANAEYAQVRISNVALTFNEVQANYRLGPNYAQTATATMSATDASGSSSFNASGQWSNGAAPSNGNSYETYDYVLRTPANATSYTFGGDSLSITGGKLLCKSTGSSTITVNNLKLDNGTVYHDGSGTFSLAGSIAVADDGATIVADNGNITLSAALSGSGSVTYYGPNSTTLSGSNIAFTGKQLVGNGYRGRITIDSEARLGPNPSTYTTNQLQFNRGTLATTTTMSIDDSNRGIYFDVSGGTFDVAAGTTLTVASPLSSVDMGTGIIASSIGKANSGTLILSSTSSTFNGAVYVDSGGNGSNDGVMRVVNNQVLANAKAIYIRDNNACTSTLQIDGSAGSITLPGVTAAARSTTVPQVQNLSGSNSIAGYFINSGGSNHIVQADAGSTLTISGPIYSVVTGDRVITFQGAGNITTASTLSELTATTVSVVKSGAGTLSLNGACSHDGSTTLSGGTLRLNGSMTTTTGATTTAAGTTFAGTGTSASPTTISGIHAPGNTTNSTGTQTFTSPLTYNATAKLNWALAANATTASSSSKVAAQGVTVTGGAAIQIVLNGTGSTVNFTNSFWTQPRSWTVLSSTAMSGLFTLGSVSNDSAGQSVASYGSFSLQQTSTGVTVAYYPLNATPPPAPTGLSGIGSPGAATLAWNSSAGATSYNLLRATIPGGPYEVVATGISGTSFFDTSTANGTTYYYVVTAVNQFGEGNASAETFATPHLPTTVIKANNSTALNQPASWENSLLPSTYDTAKWVSSAANSVILGANTSLNGIVIESTAGAVSIGAGNTLTLGANGIEMSAATQNLTIASGLTLGAGNQTWNVLSGRTLTLTTGSFTRTMGATLNIQGAGSVTPTMAGLQFSSLSNGIVGSWATFGTGSATRYATIASSGASISALTGTSTTWAGTINSTSANYEISAAATVTYGASERIANTIRYSGGAGTVISLGSNNNLGLTVNGILNAGTGDITFNQGGGTSATAGVHIGAANELVLNAATAGITINANIHNNGTNSSSVTVNAQGSNTVVLAGQSTYTGGTVLAAGELGLGADSTLTSGTLTSGPLGTGTLTLYGGTLNPRFGGTQTVANAMTVTGDFTLNGRINTTAIVLAGSMNLTGGTRTVTVPAASSGSTTISGVISNGSFTKDGTGTLTVSGANTYAGGTTVIAGTLNLGNVLGLGASTGSLTVNGGTLDLNALSPTVGALSGAGGSITTLTSGTSTLTANSPASATFAGALQNGGSGKVLALTKQGTGTLTLSGTSNYTGVTTISAGTLVVDGALTGNSAVAVSNGATLAGTGTSSGPVTVASGGALAPGTGQTAGTLTISGALTLSNGSVLQAKLATTGTSSKIALSGILNASGVTTINLASLSGFRPGVYPLITGAATINASNFALGSTLPGYTYALTASNGTLSLTVAAPPATPTGLTTTGTGTSSIALNWTAVPGATSYNVKRSVSCCSGFTTIATGVTATNQTDTGLTGGTTYYYVVSAVNIAGESDDSDEASAMPLTASETWRQQNFGTTANSGNAADTFDANDDGELNLMEFATAQNPNAATTATPSLVRNGANLEFTYTRANAALADGLTFSVEWRDDLAAGAWSTAGVTEQILTDNGTAQTVKATLPTGSGPRFVHLKVTKP
jgi:autotransporter-associated beta strand protein